MRRISVDGGEYLWKADGVKDPRERGWHPSHRRIRLRVRAHGGSVMEAVLFSKLWDDSAQPSYDSLNHCVDPDCEGCDSQDLHRAALTPGDVAKCVRAALASGWSPASRARSFLLEKVPADLTDYGPEPVRDEKAEALALVTEVMVA